jgi:hypothetical protein
MANIHSLYRVNNTLNRVFFKKWITFIKRGKTASSLQKKCPQLALRATY